MTGQTVIRFDKVTKRFDEATVLDGLSFSVARGETFAIVGPSGTGKSVTLKHIVGLVSPDSGEIEVATAHVGYLFQSGALLAWMSVWDNVALPLREATRLSEEEIEKKVDAALDAVGLAAAADRYPSEISGGMQKRAGLARALVRDADLILYDEPTSGLDPVTARSINRIIVDLRNRRGVTSVIVTHDLAAALAMADRIMLLKEGRAAFCGSPAEFLSSGEPAVAEFVDAMKGNAA